MSSSWTCEICNTTLKISSKYGHLKTKKHLQNLSLIETEEKQEVVKGELISKDCIICCETSTKFKNCISCKQEWCQNCDSNIFECPYCRQPIRGREEKSRRRKRENFVWQTDDPVFVNAENNR